jgi:precorrin-2 dehydrogenase / sirohydrochlorin ferrochelatase
MAVFPLFIDLNGKRCIVIGGGKVATRKAETLLEFQTDVIVVSPEISGRLQELHQCGNLTWRQKIYTADDLEGAFLVIAATSDRLVNEEIYEDSVAKGIMVNTADDPDKCTFIFPSVVKRDDLVIGISTSGKYPALSKAVRKKMEKMLTPNINGEMLGLLAECRQRAIREVKDASVRKELIERLLEELLFCEEASSNEVLYSKIDRIFGDYNL